jgi:hypothetical protein
VGQEVSDTHLYSLVCRFDDAQKRSKMRQVALSPHNGMTWFHLASYDAHLDEECAGLLRRALLVCTH